MKDVLDTTYWSGDNDKFITMIQATENAEDFDMMEWGYIEPNWDSMNYITSDPSHDFPNPNRHFTCNTPCCLWGNYVLKSGLLDALPLISSIISLGKCSISPTSIFGTLGKAAEHLGISIMEFKWLFTCDNYEPRALFMSNSDQILASLRRGLLKLDPKPTTREFNLGRLKKYYSWKRRKEERIELDRIMQENDRILLREYQNSMRRQKCQESLV